MLQAGSQQNPRAAAGRTTETSPDPKIVAQLREPRRGPGSSFPRAKKKKWETSQRHRGKKTGGRTYPTGINPRLHRAKGKPAALQTPTRSCFRDTQGWAHPRTSPPKPGQPHGSPIPAPSPLPDPAREHAACCSPSRRAPPPRALFPPARHFHTSAANRGPRRAAGPRPPPAGREGRGRPRPAPPRWVRSRPRIHLPPPSPCPQLTLPVSH